MKQKKEDRLAILLAKTGVFFANCDNNYDDREHTFIINFTERIMENKTITPEIKKEIEKIESKSISIDMLIKETQDFISELLSDEEKDPFVNAFSEFIKGIIDADEILHRKEDKYFEMWKKEMYSVI